MWLFLLMGVLWFLLNSFSLFVVRYRSCLLVNYVVVRLPSVMITYYHLSFEHS